MKKLLFVFAIVASFTASAQVQNELGLVVGPNVHYTTIKFDYGKLTPGVGFAGGITNNLYLGKHLSLYTGAMYEHRRFSRNDYAFIDIWPSPTGANFTENYVMVPLMVRYGFGNGKVQPFANAGAQFGFGFKRTTEWNYQNQQDPIWYPQNTVNKNLELNISVAFGAGVKINITDRIGITAEFRQSFWMLSDSEGYTTRVTDEFATPMATSYLLTGASYRFGK